MKKMARPGSSILLPCSTQPIYLRMRSMSTVKKESSPSERSKEMSELSSLKIPRIRKGKWAGLTAVSIAKLMGVSPHTAKRYLYKVRPMDLDDIGKLVQTYRNERENRKLGSLLRHW